MGVPLTPALQDAVTHEQLRMVLLHTRLATVAASAFATLLCITLVNHPANGLPASTVWAWLAVKLGMAVARMLLAQLYLRRQGPPQPWQRWMLLLLALDGLVWGVAGWRMMSEPIGLAAVAVAVMDGVSCVATFGLQVSLQATLAYAAPIVLPVMLGLTQRHDEVSAFGGAGQLILLLLLLSTAHSSSRRLAMGILARIHAQEMARQKEAALELAHEQSALRNQFLAKVSHELRTPLHGMLGLARLLQQDAVGRDNTHRLELLQRSGAHLLGLINDLLDVARIDSGRFALREHNFDLAAQVQPVADVFALRAAEKGLEFALRWQLPQPCWVRGDAVRLNQVLNNLLGNAVKFTRRGGILLLVSPGVQHDGVRFAVHDTGEGIGAAERTRIFHPFHQADSDAQQPSEGVGLGLTIAREIVAAMGAEIHLRSELGHGSTFSFEVRLPRVGPSAGLSLTPERATDAAQPVQRLPRLVLLAEDDDVSALIATAFLEGLGVRCERVTDGQQAVAGALRETDRPEMVLMDCRMPVLDGPGATAEIRRQERARGLPRLPILALTATTAEPEVQAALAAGMDDVVAKPFSPERLAMAMRGVRAAQAIEALGARAEAGQASSRPAVGPASLAPGSRPPARPQPGA